MTDAIKIVRQTTVQGDDVFAGDVLEIGKAISSGHAAVLMQMKKAIPVQLAKEELIMREATPPVQKPKSKRRKTIKKELSK